MSEANHSECLFNTLWAEMMRRPTYLQAARMTPNRSSWCRSVSLLVVLGNLCGCAGTMRLKHGLEAVTAIDPLPVSIGVYYDESILSHVHEQKSVGDHLGTWKIPIGEASAQLLDTCFAGMFEHVTRLESWSPGEPVPPELAGVILPAIEEISFEEIPRRNDLEARDMFTSYKAAVVYRVDIYAPRSSSVISMAVSGNGSAFPSSSNLAMFGPSAASAVEEAMRAAAARLIIEFPKHAGVRGWLRRQGVGRSIERQMFGTTSRQLPSPDATQRGMAVFQDPASYPREGYRTIADRVAHKVRKKLRWVSRSSPLIDAEALRNSLFPWWERTTMPKTDGAMIEFLRVPVVQRKLQELGVGYLILVQGSSVIDAWEGPFLQGEGVGAVAFVGWTGRDEAATASAVVWDIQSRRSFRAAASDEGRSTIVGLLFLPLPLMAKVEAKTIDALADQLVEHFSAIYKSP